MAFNFNLNQEQFFFIGFGIIVAWMATLTLLVIQMLNHYRNLTKNVSKKDLKSILDELLRQSGEQTRTVKEIMDQIEKIKLEDLGHLQKIGFMRFNPFTDTGGDQSFILTLLDAQDNGFVVSSLHTRGTTRIYAKQVKEGKGKDFELSEEEKKVISQARKIRSTKT